MEAVKVTRGYDLRGGAAWVCPPLGAKKLNTDAAKREGRLIGLGAIVRDEGTSQWSFCEALALRQGLKVAWEASFRTLIMESDCLALVEAVKKKCQSQFEASIKHILRAGNGASHSPAKLSFEWGGFLVWLEEAPRQVLQIAEEDVT
ncbi:4-hydroxybenzoate 3-monooxygenase [Bienertia sinuspersici]